MWEEVWSDDLRPDLRSHFFVGAKVLKAEMIHRKKPLFVKMTEAILHASRDHYYYIRVLYAMYWTLRTI